MLTCEMPTTQIDPNYSDLRSSDSGTSTTFLVGKRLFYYAGLITLCCEKCKSQNATCVNNGFRCYLIPLSHLGSISQRPFLIMIYEIFSIE